MENISDNVDETPPALAPVNDEDSEEDRDTFPNVAPPTGRKDEVTESTEAETMALAEEGGYLYRQHRPFESVYRDCPT